MAAQRPRKDLNPDRRPMRVDRSERSYKEKGVVGYKKHRSYIKGKEMVAIAARLLELGKCENVFFLIRSEFNLEVGEEVRTLLCDKAGIAQCQKCKVWKPVSACVAIGVETPELCLECQG